MAMYQYSLLAYSHSFIRQLWHHITTAAQLSLFCSTPLISLLAQGIKMTSHERDEVVPHLAVFSSLFGYLLVTIHDSEFYSSTGGEKPGSAAGKAWMPFTLAELVSMSTLLRDIFIVRQLYNRDTHRQFCPSNHWIYDKILFQTLVMRDKAEHQGEQVNFMQGPAIDLSIRRNYIYEDSYDKLSKNNEPNLIKLKLRVQLVNAVGLDEAGIDGCGLFRVFLNQLLKAAFDPNRASLPWPKTRCSTPTPVQIRSTETPLLTISLLSECNISGSSLAVFVYLSPGNGHYVSYTQVDN